MSKKDMFDKLWDNAKIFTTKEKKQIIKEEMRPYFKNEATLIDYVDEQAVRKIKNSIARKTRFVRKAYNNEFNYFVTFTYDDNKHTEQSFKYKLIQTISNLQKRKGWKYMGVWERGAEKERLHFHGLFYIPDGTMVGELIEVEVYNKKQHKRKIVTQNTYFNDRFGRCDMEELYQHPQVYGVALGYILKYIGKSGDKIVYSHGLKTYFLSDIDENEVIMRCGIENKKLILADNFTCIDNGEIIGEISPEIKRKLRPAN